MDHGVVHAQGVNLVQTLLQTALDAVGEAEAQRQMAGRVLVEQRVVEQDAALADRRRIRNQRSLAQIGGAFVHVDELAQQRLVLFRVPFDGFALMEADPEILDQLPVVAQGLAGVDDTLRAVAAGRSEALFRGHVRIEFDALAARFAAAGKQAFRDEPHREICTVSGLIDQFFDAESVQVSAALPQVAVVLLPSLDGVTQRAGGLQDLFPEFFHRLARPQSGEQFLRPLLAGDGGDGPLVIALHRVAVGLDDLAGHLHALAHLSDVDALQPVRVVAHQEDAAHGQVFGIVLPARLHVVGHRAQRLDGLVAVGQFFQGLIVPVHHDLLRLQTVAFLCHHRRELREFQSGTDVDLLALLYVDPHAGDQFRVFS